MMLCGTSIIGFTVSVFLDVVTREIGAPWLWLQQVTTGFFAWGVFIGMAAATRRNDHLNLVEITKRLNGPQAHLHGELQPPRRAAASALAMVCVRLSRTSMHDLGSFRMPSLIPLA